MLKKVDLVEELREEKERHITDELLVEVHDILLQEAKREAGVRSRLSSACGTKSISEGRLDPSRVFDLATIKQVAIRYRLRFLDAKYFKNPYPREAINATKHLEDGLEHDLTDFKILAPASAFELCDVDADPLLFVPVGNDRFYLVYKWGQDFTIARRLIFWPLRKPLNLLALLFSIAMVITCLVPNTLLSTNPTAHFLGLHRFMLFIWTSCLIASISFYTWFTFFGKFSTNAWNDHRFN